jgi:hypothetical protein
MTPLPPTPEEIAFLRAALGDTVEPHQYTDEQLAGMITAAGSVEAAAALGWTMKAMAAADARGGMIEYRIGTEGVRYLDPTAYRQLCLDNARLWQGRIPDALTTGSLFGVVPPAVLDGCLPEEVDLSRLEAEALERPVIARRSVDRRRSRWP